MCQRLSLQGESEPPSWKLHGFYPCRPVPVITRPVSTYNKKCTEQSREQAEIQDYVTEGFRFRVEQNHNITLEQRKALSTLAKDTHIIIKPADKGGQIVLQDKAHYLQEALRQLYNTTYYRPLAHSMQPETQGLVRQLVSGLYSKGYISKKLHTVPLK